MSGGQAVAPWQWRGHPLQLLAARALWDPQQGLLLLADLHLGKAESFQAQGIPLPSDGDASTLAALAAVVEQVHPREVIVLGDLVHSRLGVTPALRQQLAQWPQRFDCRLSLIGGNHDRGLVLEGLALQPAQARGPLWLSHEPDSAPGLLNVCGHGHPVACVGDGADQLRLPCFAYDPALEQLMLPSFGHLTGGHPCAEGCHLWLVAEDAIVPWPPSPLRPPRPGRRQRQRP